MVNIGENNQYNPINVKNYSIYCLIFLLIELFLFGLTIDKSIEKNYNKDDNVRELTESEQIDKIITRATMFAIIIIGVYIVLLLLFLNNL